MLRTILIAALGVLIAAVSVIGGMIIFGTSGDPPALASIGKPFESVDFSDLPALQKTPARDGTPIAFRVWPASPSVSDPKRALIAIHGSSAMSSSMHPLGKALSTLGMTVYAPDIRGHGSTGARGDIDYPGQLDDDLADFTAAVAKRQPDAELVLLGFSSGGGYALHAAATPLGKRFAHTVLLSPMLGVQSPTAHNPAQAWARPFIPRIIALALLDRVGIHAFDHLTAIAFAIDPRRADILTAHYSFALMRAFGTSDYAADLRHAASPLAVLVGGKDELFFADKFAPTVGAIRPDIPVAVVPDLSHIEMITDARAVPAIAAAIRGTDLPK